MASRKKTNIALAVLLLICLAVGALAGYFGMKAMCAHDTFALVGDKQVVLNVGDTYTEKGAKCVAFGKDISGKVVAKGNVDTTKEGVYYIKYTIDNIKYGKITRIRTVIVEAVA